MVGWTLVRGVGRHGRMHVRSVREGGFRESRAAPRGGGRPGRSMQARVSEGRLGAALRRTDRSVGSREVSASRTQTARSMISPLDPTDLGASLFRVSAPSFLSSRLHGDFLISTGDCRATFMAQLVVRNLEDDAASPPQRAVFRSHASPARTCPRPRAAPGPSPAAPATRATSRASTPDIPGLARSPPMWGSDIRRSGTSPRRRQRIEGRLAREDRLARAPEGRVSGTAPARIGPGVEGGGFDGDVGGQGYSRVDGGLRGSGVAASRGHTCFDRPQPTPVSWGREARRRLSGRRRWHGDHRAVRGQQSACAGIGTGRAA